MQKLRLPHAGPACNHSVTTRVKVSESMVGAVRDFFPQAAVAHVTGAGMPTRDVQEALEAIRDLAESRAPGALAQILAIAVEALQQKRA